MAFSSFASFRPLLAALNSNIPPSNNPNLLNISINNNNSKAKKQDFNIPCDQTMIVSSPRHEHKSSILDVYKSGVDIEAPAKVKFLKRILREIEDPWEILNLIDATQRLGIDHNFQEEIEAILHTQYVLSNAHQFDRETDLQKAALLFRLLRQQGYFVSQDLFKIFMDHAGKFEEELKQDINGLMSLYEASQLCMKGEDILEEAGKFSSHKLKAHYNLASLVHITLAHPYHKSMAQFMISNYFGDFKWTNKWIYILQDIAKMDFNITQRLRQTEISQFLTWWKETGLARELKFARDQPVKWYIASLVCLTDPCYSEERVDLAKLISFVYLIDDLYDVFGTLDELTFFTETVCRWDLAAAEKLPECMQICFKTLHEVTNEISYKIYQKHGLNPIASLRKAWAKLCKAFLVEAEWLSSGHSPTAEEYLKNGIITTGIPLVLVHVFFLLGQQISCKQTVELLEDNLAIVSSSATILRLSDDLGSAKDEKQDGRDGSYVEYYMKEHPNVSYEDTKQHIIKKISDEWKTLNRESLLSAKPFPTKFAQASLNVARAVPVGYNYGSNQSLPTIEQLMESLLFHPAEI